MLLCHAEQRVVLKSVSHRLKSERRAGIVKAEFVAGIHERPVAVDIPCQPRDRLHTVPRVDVKVIPLICRPVKEAVCTAVVYLPEQSAVVDALLVDKHVEEGLPRLPADIGVDLVACRPVSLKTLFVALKPAHTLKQTELRDGNVKMLLKEPCSVGHAVIGYVFIVCRNGLHPRRDPPDSRRARCKLVKHGAGGRLVERVIQRLRKPFRIVLYFVVACAERLLIDLALPDREHLHSRVVQIFVRAVVKDIIRKVSPADTVIKQHIVIQLIDNAQPLHVLLGKSAGAQIAEAVFLRKCFPDDRDPAFDRILTVKLKIPDVNGDPGCDNRLAASVLHRHGAFVIPRRGAAGRSEFYVYCRGLPALQIKAFYLVKRQKPVRPALSGDPLGLFDAGRSSQPLRRRYLNRHTGHVLRGAQRYLAALAFALCHIDGMGIAWLFRHVSVRYDLVIAVRYP